MGKKLWKRLMVLAVTAAMLLGTTLAHAAGETPTRTSALDLRTMTTAEDHLADEGWKWEPTQDGGTLTLRNFYQQGVHDHHGLIQAKGNITLLLEGNNVLETTSDLYWPLLEGDDVKWTVREGASGGKLTLKMPSSTNRNLPYGFFGKKLTILSGDIHAEMVLAFPEVFEMSGGSVTVDKGTGHYAAIQSLMGDVTLTGGKVQITGSVCGIASKNVITSDGKGDILIDGADVKIDATVVALSGEKIQYKNGSLDIAGGTRAANRPIQTTIPGVGTTTDGQKNVPYDANANVKFVSFMAKHAHAGQADVWEHNDVEHWQLCTCGKAMEAQPHQFVEKHDAASHWQECVCGAKKNAASHTYGAWVETKAPTQTATGLKTRTCITCGYEDSEEVAMLPAELPKTGDETPLGIFALVLVLCGAALLMMRRGRMHPSAK